MQALSANQEHEFNRDNTCIYAPRALLEATNFLPFLCYLHHYRLHPFFILSYFDCVSTITASWNFGIAGRVITPNSETTAAFVAYKVVDWKSKTQMASQIIAIVNVIATTLHTHDELIAWMNYQHS